MQAADENGVGEDAAPTPDVPRRDDGCAPDGLTGPAIALLAALREHRLSDDRERLALAMRHYARQARDSGSNGVALLAEFRLLYDAVFAPQPSDLVTLRERERWATRLITYFGETG